MHQIHAIMAVAATITLTVVAQIVVKWQVIEQGTLPPSAMGRLEFVFALLTRPWTIVAMMMIFVAAIAWMLAMTRLRLSFAYPFLSLTFPLVLLASAIVFGEPVSWRAAAGTLVIIAGLALVAS
jgi:multidrug transporter EmrE-like cation transporter